MDTFTIYTGSEGQTVSQQITRNGRPFDLTTSTVKFFLRLANSDVLKVDDENASVVDASSGQVSYDWDDTNLDEPGEYFGWWRVVQPDTSEIDSDEFFLIVRQHAPGVRTRTGVIYEFCRSIIPSTWGALEKDDNYGDALLQKRVEVQKAKLFVSPPTPENEEDLDIRIQQYVAKVTVLGLISTAMEYWMNQREAVSASGTAEVVRFPERIEHLKNIRDQLTREVVEERDEIEEIIDLSPIVTSNTVPEFSPGTEEGFLTPLPGNSFFDYAFPDNDDTLW
jgi:hypothetical protein